MPFPKTGKAHGVNIQRKYYTMATTDGETAEVTMYGDIVECRPTDWYGNPVEGSFIIQSEFMEDLKQIENCKNITIRMNSCGGDASVSILIHNRLRELARNGASLTCIVDGAAMSGGSLIMCACDTVRVNPSSLIMIHKCWTFLFGGYNADELRQVAESNDAYDNAQVSIYTRKSKLTETVVRHMMADTTYMTGKEAVEKGFADEVLDDAEPVAIAASADGRSLIVCGRQMHHSPGMFVPDSIPTVESEPEEPGPVEANKNEPAETGDKGGNNPMTLEELREKHPDLVAQVEADAKAAGQTEATNAANAERQRLAAIDEVASLFTPEQVHEAKYGEHPCTAEELVMQAAKNAAKKGQKFLSELEDDAEASGAKSVGAAPGSDLEGGSQNTIEQARADAKAYNASKKEAR